MIVAPRQFGGILSLDLIVGRDGNREAIRTHNIRQQRAVPTARDRLSTDRPDSLEAVMSHEAHTDEIMFDAYRAGDREAFHTLMRRYCNELIHFLTRYLGSRTAADDVFQETFLQIHQSADTFDSSRRFKPWLFTIAANKARDYHRKYSKRTTVSLSNTIDVDGEGRQFVDLMESDIPTPESPLVDSERCRLVKQVVDSLPGHLREILLLSYFQQMSYNQIAVTLEIPLGTVKSRLHTAVASFARNWKTARESDAAYDQLSDEMMS